ncbi:MAG TPA: hypothetical protein VGL76_03915 [Gaiellaceae bacterium]
MLYGPPPHSTGVDVWGQPSRSAEVAGRPLGSTLQLFRAAKRVRLPAQPPFQPLAVLATRMRGHPGSLELAKTRRFEGLYLVPTTNGWVCVQATRFQTCVRGLLRAGVVWMFQSAYNGIDIWGLAANNVSHLRLGSKSATLRDNVFFVFRPMKLTSTAHLPKTFGTLLVTYRDGRAPARVVIH